MYLLSIPFPSKRQPFARLAHFWSTSASGSRLQQGHFYNLLSLMSTFVHVSASRLEQRCFLLLAQHHRQALMPNTCNLHFAISALSELSERLPSSYFFHIVCDFAFLLSSVCSNVTTRNYVFLCFL